MSIKIMSQVWEHADVSDTDLLLLLAMADFANDDCTCWPSIETLAKRIRKTTRSVTRSVNSLEKKGLIQVLVRGAGRQSSRYKIIVSAFQNNQETRGDNLSPVTPMSPQPRQPCHPSPDTDVTSALTPMSTKPSIEPPKKPSKNASKKKAHKELDDDALKQLVWDDNFENFWNYYPRKVSKQKSREAWSKLKGDESLYYEIVHAVGKWMETKDWIDSDGQFIPYPVTFLNQRRWEDEIPPPAPIDRTDPKWMAENDDYTAIGGTRATPEAEYDALAKQHGWDKMDWDEE